MSVSYPAGPAVVAPALTQASAVYRRQAWIAMAALLAFGVFYFLLAGWFGWKAWSLLRAAVYGARDGVWLGLGGVAAAFICAFMLKALFFVRRGELQGLTEISAQEQPELFAFIHRLADEARAPRPRKVFVSARVNASVFYDLSPLNLLWPSRKNLEIGLALVNVLNASEFKAVLAHEFGHFAQRSMAVGRWVYVAQQIAAHLVARRDALDGFLRGLSNFDIRIAWIGWCLSLVVWSIRSIVDTFFRIVLAAERALSREMEFQADRISVSLTGSDALIQALYRCQAADQAWDRALAFAEGELRKGRCTADLFDVQSQVIVRLREILGDPGFGAPPAPAGDPAAHRVFQQEMVQPPRMWSSHPPNHEREENAKRTYLPVPPESAPAWELFRDAGALRLQICARMVAKVDPPLPTATREQTDEALRAEFGRESFRSAYRGRYLARPVTRSARNVDELYGPRAVTPAECYPPELAALLKEMDRLQTEKAQLEALLAGQARAADGQIRFRGKVIQPRQLPAAVDKVGQALGGLEQKLAEHDRACRSLALAMAQAQPAGWAAYLRGLLQLVHYTEHLQANIADAHRALGNVVTMVTAKRRVSNAERKRVQAAADTLYRLLEAVHGDRNRLKPDAATMALAGFTDWPAALGEFNLSPPAESNLGQWLDVVEGWMRPIVEALARLRRCAVDQLLLTEARLVQAGPQRATLEEAPAAPEVPGDYPVFLAGAERPLQQKLDWWSRFLTADGWGPGSVRLAVAGGIVFSLMGLSGSLGVAHVALHNGLARTVVVEWGQHKTTLSPGATTWVDVPAEQPLAVTTRTQKGQVVERFSETPDIVGGHYVYNVAGASPLVEWTATYGQASAQADRPLGAPRWLLSSADHVLEAPPRSIQTKGGGGIRTVLEAPAQRTVRNTLAFARNDAVRTAVAASHARWDAGDSASVMDWLSIAASAPGFDGVLRARLQDDPMEVVSLRAQQDHAGDNRAGVCEAQRRLAEANPRNGDLQYLAARCAPDDAARNAAFKEGLTRFPDNGWFGFAAAATYAEQGDMAAAMRAYQACWRAAPMVDYCALELARLRRLEAGMDADLRELVARSDSLQQLAGFEQAKLGDPAVPPSAYALIAHGRIADAYGQLQRNGQQDPRALRIAAASDGASPELVRKALALPPTAGLDQDVVWSAIGLAIRQGVDPRPMLALLDGLPPEQRPRLLAFIEGVRKGDDLAGAEKALAGLPVAMRAHAYELGVVALGERAPAAWRAYARKALFIGERPYLG